MPRVTYEGKTQSLAVQRYTFTVLFEALMEIEYVPSRERRGRLRKGSRLRVRNPVKEVGYQVRVPALPGLITYGRTLAEARAMARDAIRCHLEGLRKAGERIPNERVARTEKLRVALTA